MFHQSCGATDSVGVTMPSRTDGAHAEVKHTQVRISRSRSHFLQTFTKSSDSDLADKSHSDTVYGLLSQSDCLNKMKLFFRKLAHVV